MPVLLLLLLVELLTFELEDELLLLVELLTFELASELLLVELPLTLEFEREVVPPFEGTLVGL